MKLITLLITATLTFSQAFADDYCASEFSTNYDVNYFRTVAQLTVTNGKANQLFREVLEQNDCYQGVCAAYFNTNEELVINFSTETGNGFRAHGIIGSYSTFSTDNGTWLSIRTHKGTESFLFRGCY